MNGFVYYIRKGVLVSLVLLFICGLGYPLLMTGVAQVVFPHQANGSLISADGKVIGSELIGQDFTKDYFLKCRPSTVSYNTYTKEDLERGSYSTVGSGSQNFAPSNPQLVERVKKDMESFLEKNPSIKMEDIPTDLLTASGSGLDPHISPQAAEIQLESIAKASGISIEKLEKIVIVNTTKKTVGIFGENTVNVLKVNLAIAKEMGLVQNIKH
ncbi:K(+)-transporting ATPase subunit C [Anaerotignum sp. MB30-C6]|uniref:K(+)-transporting ATPase subunit C n=1 Tax=Anaerotignum sp. MB30-C6 TaxID=3070814 RepID=UPI0027DB43FB|nr:K(+)-transporting ATPase subunit C [Anaerotignum sp. MB30-C6]WMI79788.1 K(+)-transporting ATPase subunit C [Anaerotignum sp. MB30-C6]